MDGTGVKTLVETRYRSLLGFTIDRRASLIYWSLWDNGYQIHRCDLDGQNLRKLNLSLPEPPITLTASGNILYWQGRDFVDNPLVVGIYRADVERETVQIISSRTYGPDNLQALLDEGNPHYLNPCTNHACSHICVQSAQKNHTCLCAEDFTLENDGRNCIGNCFTLVSPD